MEGFLAGIAIGFLLWGLCPFASYFYLGMGDRSDRAKKIFTIVIMALGVVSFVTAAYDLVYPTSITNKNVGISYASFGTLCFAQCYVIFSRIRKKKFEERIAALERDYEEQLNMLNKSLIDNFKRHIKLYHKKTRLQKKDTSV